MPFHRRKPKEQCPHEPINASYNTYKTDSGKEYFRCRFCLKLIEVKNERKIELKKMKRIQRSTKFFMDNNFNRHWDDKNLTLVPNAMQEDYKTWRDTCTCGKCRPALHGK